MKYIKKVSASYQGDTPIATSISSTSTNDEVAGAKAVYDNSLDVYSTTEQRVGTWIDGKPLYRKVGSIVITTKVGDHTIGSLIDSNLDWGAIEGVFGQDCAISSNLYNSFETTIGSNIYLVTTKTHRDYGHIMGFTNRDDLLNKTFYVVVLYTKTTDSAS